MNSVTSPLAIRKRKLVAFRGRGEIYSWLRVHAAEIAPRLERGEATWPTVCAEMVRHGICGRGGEAPTPNAAMRVWHRVVRDVEAEGAAPAKRRRLYPSRLPKDWRPPSVPAPAKVPVVSASASSDDYDSQKAMAALRRIMNERSGRKE